MRIPENINIETLIEELQPRCLERLGGDEYPDDPRHGSLGYVGAYLVFFIGYLSKKRGKYKDKDGWTRIHSRDLELSSPFYVVINTYLEEKGIIEKQIGSWKPPTDNLSRRNGYRLTPEYASAKTKLISYDAESIRKNLFLPPVFQTDDFNRISIKIDQLAGFDDADVQGIIGKLRVLIDAEIHSATLMP